tara:strand:- start:386 stop:637 length:252 start_codon:yes stop_codon:yes gene_type:complete
MSNIKLSEIELQQLNDIKVSRNRIIMEFGNISILRKQLEDRENAALIQWNSLQTSERTLAKTLEDKYGKGTVNIETGEFVPID